MIRIWRPLYRFSSDKSLAYKRAYNRLKAIPQRGKLNVDQWNIAMAKAQDLLAQSKQSKLTNEKLREK